MTAHTIERPSHAGISIQRSASRRLGADELHVWQASLDWGPEVIDALSCLLSRDECDRAARFRFERDRSRFIAGRGMLRILLCCYLGEPAREIEFTYGRYRKPFLASGGPWFNVSHSGDVALFAFSDRAEIGIDVELANPRFAGERIPEHFFSLQEVRRLRSLPEALQPRAFMECWTRKEAFIKARGDGLSLALDSFTVTLGPGSPVALVSTAWSLDEPRRWTLVDISDPGERFVAAIAVPTGSCRVVKHRVAGIIKKAIVAGITEKSIVTGEGEP